MPTVNHAATKVKRVFSILKVQKDLRDANQLSDGAQRLAGQMLDIVSSIESDPEVRVCRVSSTTLQEWSGKGRQQIWRYWQELEQHKIFIRVQTGQNIPTKVTNVWLFDDVPLAALADETRAARKKQRSTREAIEEARAKLSKPCIKNVTCTSQTSYDPGQQSYEGGQKSYTQVPPMTTSSGSSLVSSPGLAPDLQQQQHSVSFVEHSPETRAARQSVATAPDQTQKLATARADQSILKEGVGGEQCIESVAMDDITTPFAPKPNMPHNITMQAINAGRVTLLAAYAKVFGKPLVQSKTYVKDSIAVVRACYIAAADNKSASGINRPSRLVHRAMEALRSDIVARDNMPNTTKQDPIRLLASKISAYDITRAEPKLIDTQVIPAPARRRPVDVSLNSDRIDPPTRPQQPSTPPTVEQNSHIIAPVDVGRPEQGEQQQDAPVGNVDATNTKKPSNWDLMSDEMKEKIRAMAHGKGFDTDNLAKTSPYRRAAVA